MFLAGVVGALLLVAAAVLLLDLGGGGKAEKAAPSPSAAKNTRPALPAGVKCNGTDCTGKDPEEMGCGGQYATSPARGLAGRTLVEVRYSEVCGAAWARITGAVQGDEVTIASGRTSRQAAAGADGDAYTVMVPVNGSPEKVKACGATNATGAKWCAKPVPTSRTTP